MRDKTAREQLENQRVRMDTLEATVRDLADNLEAIRKPVRDLEMEWEDWFLKFRNLLARLNKRSERESEPKVEELEPVQAGLPTDMNPLALQLLKRGAGE